MFCYADKAMIYPVQALIFECWNVINRYKKINILTASHPLPHERNLTFLSDPSNLEAVCWNYHSGAIQSEEVLGYNATIGANGWPVDRNNPSVR